MSALYRQVSDHILEQISKGERKVGDQLPPEVEFASELGVSRSTVRLAFNQLESGGVLRRRKRAGTKIIAAALKTQFKIDTAGFEELVCFMREAPMQIHKMSVVSTEDIPELQKFDGKSEQWLEVYSSRRWHAGERPVCMNRVYVPSHFSNIQESLRESGASVLSTIEKEHGVRIGRIVHKAKPVVCPALPANIMELEAGAAVIECEAAMYEKGGRLMEVVISHSDGSDSMMVGELLID